VFEAVKDGQDVLRPRVGICVVGLSGDVLHGLPLGSHLRGAGRPNLQCDMLLRPIQPLINHAVYVRGVRNAITDRTSRASQVVELLPCPSLFTTLYLPWWNSSPSWAGSRPLERYFFSLSSLSSRLCDDCWVEGPSCDCSDHNGLDGQHHRLGMCRRLAATALLIDGERYMWRFCIG
jgi:hypothetical protein